MTEIFNSSLSPVVELVRRYGGPVSHAALDPSRSIFRVPGIDGLIAFLPTYKGAVVLGDPVCAPENKAALADAFAAHCAGNNRSILYTAASATMQTYASYRGYGTMEFASLLFANPQHDPEEGHQGYHLRQHLNHTRRAGVIVHEYMGETSPDALLEAQAEVACKHWLNNRHGPQMYLGCLRIFEDRQGRRWFIAKHADTVVGVLSMLQARCIDSGSLINIVFSSPAAPLHTNELLVVAALRALREEGASAVCLGIGPRAELGLMAKVMHLHGKTEFWEKFHVTRREPMYLLFQSPHIDFRALSALLRAFHFSML
jgi:lysylphosphatidylglycerol synthetase-like protein (DUF2156 family)